MEGGLGAVMNRDSMRVRSPLDERIRQLLTVVEYRKMEQVEDRDAVQRMRFEGFRQSFDVVQGWQGFDDAEYENHRNIHTLGVIIGGKLASSIRITVITPKIQNSWALETYNEELQPKLEAGAVLIEVSRLVVDPKCALHTPELPYLTFRAVAMACVHYRADECFSILRMKHVPFYKRLFNGEALGNVYFYAPFQCEAQLVVSRLNVIRDQLNFRFSSFGSTYLERRQLFGPAEIIPGVSPVPLKVA